MLCTAYLFRRTLDPYMQDALNHLKQNGLPIPDNDVAGLWPLRHEHMNVLGHYSFALTDNILAGEHRPLNQLETAFGEQLGVDAGFKPG